MKEKRDGDGGREKSVGKSMKKVKRDKKTAEKDKKKTDKNRRWIKLALVRTEEHEGDLQLSRGQSRKE